MKKYALIQLPTHKAIVDTRLLEDTNFRGPSWVICTKNLYYHVYSRDVLAESDYKEELMSEGVPVYEYETK